MPPLLPPPRISLAVSLHYRAGTQRHRDKPCGGENAAAAVGWTSLIIHTNCIITDHHCSAQKCPLSPKEHTKGKWMDEQFMRITMIAVKGMYDMHRHKRFLSEVIEDDISGYKLNFTRVRAL